MGAVILVDRISSTGGQKKYRRFSFRVKLNLFVINLMIIHLDIFSWKLIMFYKLNFCRIFFFVDELSFLKTSLYFIN